jgi:hypothetical protein
MGIFCVAGSPGSGEWEAAFVNFSLSILIVCHDGGTAVDPIINDLQISQELLVDQDEINLDTIPPSIEEEFQKAMDFDDIRHEIELIDLSVDSEPIIDLIDPQTLEPVQEERLIGNL